MRKFTIEFANGITITAHFNHGYEAINYGVDYGYRHNLGYNFKLIDSLQEELEKGLNELEKKLLSLKSKK